MGISDWPENTMSLSSSRLGASFNGTRWFVQAPGPIQGRGLQTDKRRKPSSCPKVWTRTPLSETPKSSSRVRRPSSRKGIQYGTDGIVWWGSDNYLVSFTGRTNEKSNSIKQKNEIYAQMFRYGCFLSEIRQDGQNPTRWAFVPKILVGIFRQILRVGFSECQPC